MPTPPPPTVFELSVTLADVEPSVSRRLLVPGAITLAKLHDVFQVAMGWTNSHLQSFEIGDARYGIPDEDAPDDELDEQDFTLTDAVGEHAVFLYEYDLGDSWIHDVSVERVARVSHGLKHAVCLGGENACPPEDCGGPSGYRNLVEVLADASHPEHRDLLDWIGGPFDPTHFDVAEVNAELQRLR